METNAQRKIGCEKYGTSVMKKEEVLLMVEASLEAGSDVPEAIADCRMIDAMLQMKQLHKVVHVHIKKTSSGFTRKGVGFYDALDGIIDARAQGAFNF